MRKLILITTALLATMVSACAPQPCYYGDDDDRYEYDDD